MAKKITVNIVGSGNVATHLIRTFLRQPEVSLNQLYARNLSQLIEFEGTANLINDISLLTPADVTILAISDTAIAELSKKMKKYHSLVVHTSGSVSMKAIQTSNKGVFYPFQTFSKQKKRIDFSNIPILIEAENEKNLLLLNQLAHILSGVVIETDFEQRKALHISGVFAANFVNHLYVQAASVLQEHKLSFDLLKPLIMEVAEKVQEIHPQLAQTGPAVREDYEMIQQHLNFLSDENQKKIYQLLSQSIMNLKND